MRALVVLSVLVLLMVPVWAEGGTNESTALDGTSLVSVETVDTAAANQDFSITVELDADAASNGTQVGWTTQICINSGVCYAPETAALSPDSDGRLWTGSIVMDDESSYVNWRIELKWPDGNSSSVPETGLVGRSGLPAGTTLTASSGAATPPSTAGAPASRSVRNKRTKGGCRASAAP